MDKLIKVSKIIIASMAVLFTAPFWIAGVIGIIQTQLFVGVIVASIFFIPFWLPLRYLLKRNGKLNRLLSVPDAPTGMTRINRESDKKKATLALCILGGWIGAHQYYSRKIEKGILYTFTAGLFFIGWIVDILKILTGSFDYGVNGRLCARELVQISPPEQDRHPSITFTDENSFDTEAIEPEYAPATPVQRIPDYDNMEGHEFERFCADILIKNGFEDVEVTRGSGDQGIDILAKKDGVKYGVQCKCYSDNIGNKAVQEAFSGKTFYHCHVASVLTNRFFTSSAKELAECNGVLLWDRDYLNALIEKSLTILQASH